MVISDEQKRRQFEEEALLHLDALHGLGLRLTGGDEARAGDLVRETVLEAWRSWDDFEFGTSCRAWLMAVLRDTFVRESRKGERRPGPIDRDEAAGRPARPDVGDVDPEAEFIDRIDDEELAEAIEGLEDELRIPLVLSDVEGLSYREAAEALRIPVGTVKSRLHRARTRLQRRLLDHAPGDGARSTTDPGADGAPEPGEAPGGIACDDALARLYEYLDGELDREAQDRVHRHVEVCRRCFPSFDFERLFLDHVRDRGLAGGGGEGLRSRIGELLDREA